MRTASYARAGDVAEAPGRPWRSPLLGSADTRGGVRRLWPGGFAAAAALFLAACTGTTYGTGTSPGSQTLRDIAGIAALGAEDREPIDYSARSPIVRPPVAGLPPPADETTVVGTTDWPDDPDQRLARIRAARADDDPFDDDVASAPTPDPGFRLPGRRPVAPPVNPDDIATRPRDLDAEAEQMRQVRAALGEYNLVDENGVPVRRFLTEPPAEYRVPDPSAPAIAEEAPECEERRGFRLPWQRRQPDC